MPNIKIKDVELIIEKLFLLIKELLTKQENNENKSKTDNIFNLCHNLFIIMSKD